MSNREILIAARNVLLIFVFCTVVSRDPEAASYVVGGILLGVALMQILALVNVMLSDYEAARR